MDQPPMRLDSRRVDRHAAPLGSGACGIRRDALRALDRAQPKAERPRASGARVIDRAALIFIRFELPVVVIVELAIPSASRRSGTHDLRSPARPLRAV